MRVVIDITIEREPDKQIDLLFILNQEITVYKLSGSKTLQNSKFSPHFNHTPPPPPPVTFLPSIKPQLHFITFPNLKMSNLRKLICDNS